MPVHCGEITLTPSMPSQSFALGTYGSIYPEYDCDLKIIELSASPLTFDPGNHETIHITGNISSKKHIDWKLLHPDGSTRSGSRSSVSADWDGKDGNGNVVNDGDYGAGLIASTNKEVCKAETFVRFQVKKSPCKLKITSFQGTATTLDPSSGGSVPFSGTIPDDSGKPVAWTITLPNGRTSSGSGTSPSANLGRARTQMARLWTPVHIPQL